MKKILLLFLFVFSLLSCSKESLQNSLNFKNTYTFLNDNNIRMNIKNVTNNKEFEFEKYNSLITLQEELNKVSIRTYINTFEGLNNIKHLNKFIDYSEKEYKPYINYKKLIHNKNKFEYIDYQHGLNNIFIPEKMNYLSIIGKEIIGNNYENIRIEKSKKLNNYQYYEINKDYFYCIKKSSEENLLNDEKKELVEIYSFFQNKDYDLCGYKITKDIENNIYFNYIILNNSNETIEVIFDDLEKTYTLNYYYNNELMLKLNNDYDLNGIVYFNPKISMEALSVLKNKKSYYIYTFDNNPLELEREFLIKAQQENFAEIVFKSFKLTRNENGIQYTKAINGVNYQMLEKTFDDCPLLYINNNLLEYSDFNDFMNYFEIYLPINNNIEKMFLLKQNLFNNNCEILKYILSNLYLNIEESTNETIFEIIDHYYDRVILNDEYISNIHNLKNVEKFSEYEEDKSSYIENVSNLAVDYSYNNFQFKYDLNDLIKINIDKNDYYNLKLDLYSLNDSKTYNFLVSPDVTINDKQLTLELSKNDFKDKIKELNLNDGDYVLKTNLLYKNTIFFSHETILDRFYSINNNSDYQFIEEKEDDFVIYKFVNDYSNVFNMQFHLEVRRIKK